MARNKELDYIRGMAMIILVAVHIFYSKVNTLLFCIPVPLFFLISGYLYKDRDTKSFKKRCYKILQVYLITFVYLLNTIRKKLIPSNG